MRYDDTTLRTLNAAPQVLSAAEHQRAADLLERIVTQTPAPSVVPARRRGVPARHRPRRRRLLLAPLAVLALVAAPVLLPSPGPDQAAYASWTPVPTTADDQSLDAAASRCGREILSGRRVDGDPALDLGRTRQFLAERRGDFVLVVHWAPATDTTTTCVVHNPPGTDEVDSLSSSSGGSDGPAAAPSVGRLGLGGISDSTGGAQRLLQERQSWWMPYADRLLGHLGDQNPFRGSIVDGAVGQGVSGVTVHAGDYTVQATVAGGKYVAWWPGAATDCVLQDSGVPRCDPIMTYDLHLADGTTVTNARPVGPG